jgi:signal transduction histidine kinase
LASNVGSLIAQQNNFSTLIVVITGSVTFGIIYLILSWNKRLEGEVNIRTGELKNTNISLMKSNELLEEANEQLKVHDKMQKEFINIAAHELRTPIMPILGEVEIIEEDLDPKTKTVKVEEEQIQLIIRNAKRLDRLASDILDVTKIESNSLKLDIEKIELNEVINETVIDFIRRPLYSINNKDIKINFNPSNNNHHQSPLFVYADKNRIQQVIFNLLDNASKFTEKGEITLSIKDDAENNSNEKCNDITIRIQDTGKGIDSEMLPRLFKKFATKSERGTGLGLYITKNIIEAHGGRIWAENNSNSKGAAFSFSLPISK